MAFDTVVAWNNGRIYFFKDDQYWAWDIASASVPAGYPRKIADGWTGNFANNIDAALWGNGGTSYFFKGDQYIHYLVAPDKADTGYPQAYAPHWPGLFPPVLDAAVNWNNGKAYFFQGSQYLRYDMNADHADAGYPLAIAGNWPGVFTQDIDAAITLLGTTTAYFFQGEQCIRYDMTADAAVPGYPKPIIVEFPGIPSLATPTSPAPPTPAPVDPPKADAPWFIDSAAHPAHGGNDVVAFTDGDSYFDDLAKAIGVTSGSTSSIELADWELQLDFALVPGDATTTMRALLTGAASRGVAIRALLNRHLDNPDPRVAGTLSGVDNSATVAFINSLPTGTAIHDNRFLNFGVHHQKFAVINSPLGLVAYSGGMDLNPNRLTGPSGLHDVQFRFHGPAALEHHVVFSNRWTDGAGQSVPLVVPAPPPATGPLQTQVVTTYGNGGIGGHPGIVPASGIGPAGYRFAPSGDQSIRDLLLHAITTARQFIYLEDQYLVSAQISTALLAALPRIERLIILIADTDAVDGDIRQAWRRRKEFIDPLVAAAPAKVSVSVGTVLYIHSKTWIFDDAFAVTGSANCSRRDYTHDSNQATGVFGATFAHDLRVRLWTKHLGLAPADVDNALTAAPNWFTPPPTAIIAKYDPNAGRDTASFPSNTDLAWDNFIDPDGS